MSYKVNKSNKVKFHKKYYLQMLNGDKTQTMRIASKRLDVKVGDIVLAVFPGFNKTLKIKILEIGYKQIKSITDDDAKREGFQTREELLNELMEIYPLLDSLSRIYFYRFEVMELENNE